ncbi:helix-turn-helix transcriptional regulator [Actinospica robiniae]|uniref:helix-turn-helix transcriptional regulator n=1 Tax=Actinospica robiniae TaxID=304901 RepID=UPI000419846D|nr:LuxR family transcriptional regulator [Actinospica robiniae]
MSATAGRGSPHSSPGERSMTLVGRHAELARLDQALSGRLPCAVVLYGEPGVGKTALLAQAARTVTEPVFVGGAFSTLAWMPLLPLRRALSRGAGVKRGVAGTPGMAGTAVSEADDFDGDAVFVAHRVCDMVGAGLLVLDDVHWADPATLEVLPSLVGRIRMLTAVRRGGAGAPVLERLAGAGFDQLDLAPLSAGDAEALALRLRADLTRHSARSIVVRSGGNPLLIEELVASVGHGGVPGTGESTGSADSTGAIYPDAHVAGSVRSSGDDRRIGDGSTHPAPLAHPGDTPPLGGSLRRAVTARLRTLSASAREAMALLALAGHALPAAELGGADVELAAAGLVVAGADGMSVRHALLGEVAAELLDPADRRALHGRLADRAAGPAEAARHRLAAGDRAAAFRAASAAAAQATTPGERADHLLLAARCADGPGEADLRLHAAEQLAAAGRHAAVAELLTDMPAQPQLQARAALVLSRALWETNDPEACDRAVLDGLEWLRPGTIAADRSGAITDFDDDPDFAPSPVEVALRVEHARNRLFVHGDAQAALPLARAALALTRGAEMYEARALYVLGSVEWILNDPQWEPHLTEAMRKARAGADVDTECRAANNLVSAHESCGDPAVARRIGEQMMMRTQRLRMFEWSRQFEALVLNLAMHAGDYEAVLDAAPRLLADPFDQLRNREQILTTITVSLADVGRADEALHLLDTVPAGIARDRFGVGLVSLARIAVLGEAGLPAAVLAETRIFLDSVQGDGARLAFTAPLIAWAALRARRPLPELGLLDTGATMLQAVPHELAGISALRQAAGLDVAAGSGGTSDSGSGFGSDSDRAATAAPAATDVVSAYRAAAACFDAAAKCWAPYHRRGELRCLWAAADALLRAGDTAEAKERLLSVEDRARERSMIPLCGHIARSLRSAGVRRSAPRVPREQQPPFVDAAPGTRSSDSAAASTLTSREREALRCAGRGLSDAAIGAQLGVSARTVETLITNARRKLGAANRAQAAAMLAGDPGISEAFADGAGSV